MAKQKYFTEYPAILKEKAKHTGVKIKKEDYCCLDYFMFFQDLHTENGHICRYMWQDG